MQRSRRASANRRTGPKIRPAQLLVAAVVLGIFLTGVIVAGILGAALIALLALLAGALLASRWPVLDHRIRLFRLAAVVACVLVAVSLLYR